MGGNWFWRGLEESERGCWRDREGSCGWSGVGGGKLRKEVSFYFGGGEGF